MCMWLRINADGRDRKIGRYYFGDYSCFISENAYYLGYTTVARTLRLSADVLNFLKCKYYSLSLIIIVTSLLQ